MKIFVGLSGGVDSAVSAARLLAAGHEVVGVFIKVWHPDFLVCNWEQERIDAMRVAAFLKIPFLTCDAEAAYRDRVAEIFIAEYARGRTPNPDILCNQVVKFGAFLEFARAQGADAIATGHYARRLDTQTGTELHRGADPNKDQSYFLWSLSSDQLKAAYFPVGNSHKSAIREEARRRGLPVADKRDSQGICFLGQVDLKAFLGHYVTLEPGSVLDETGRVIGQHQSAYIYTLGQRHGFTLLGETAPHYVVAKDIKRNTITVSRTPPTHEATLLTLEQTVLRAPLENGDRVTFQTRYRGPIYHGEIAAQSGATLTIACSEKREASAAGQSCVLYRDTLCLGGGIISP
jgi:tRNA-specific 2-thiouridylase